MRIWLAKYEQIQTSAGNVLFDGSILVEELMVILLALHSQPNTTMTAGRIRRPEGIRRGLGRQRRSLRAVQWLARHR